jgi:hypothetical protein
MPDKRGLSCQFCGQIAAARRFQGTDAMKRLLSVLSLVVCLVLVAATDRAEAQHVSFSFGHYYGHHHHCWGPAWYRPYWDIYYAPPPRVTYVQPAPVIVQQQAAVAPPATSALASNAPATVPSTTNSIAATPVKNSLPAYRGAGVTIHNRSSVGLAVSCIVDGQTELHLAPNESRTLREKATYIVEFDRGGNFGTAKYELSEGEYQFAVGDRGWDITRDAVSFQQTATRPELKPNTLPATIR